MIRTNNVGDKTFEKDDRYPQPIRIVIYFFTSLFSGLILIGIGLKRIGEKKRIKGVVTKNLK